ncbi:MAG: glycosyltransferase family 2 protein [Lachnospiraceae bacterium]|nr:glycosyltransferase family 2 protein [Lachnospiraceae bacterium]
MITIVVPIFNAEKYIVETMERVFNQTYPDWELLLIDDGSTDGSINKIKEFLAGFPAAKQDKVKLILKEKNEGAAKARNTGLDNAKGQYIAFLDSDDLWHYGKLEKQLAFIKEKEAAFTFTAYEFGDEKARGTGKFVFVPPSLTYRKALSRTTIFTSTTLFDLAKIDKELLKMPEVKSEDTATWWRILRHGYTAYGLNEVTTIYRRPKGSLSANKLEAVKRIWFLYRKAEKLKLLDSLCNFTLWAARATIRRL